MTDVNTDASYRVTADELRQFIERFERLEIEKKDLADQQVSEVAQDYQKHNRKAAQTEASE